MEKYTRNYLNVWKIVLILLAVYLLAQLIGANRFRWRGIPISFPNQSTYKLYKINDTMAFEISDSSEFISIIGYEKTSGLYALAGKYQHNGDSIFMVSADYEKGNYIYSTFPKGRTSIVNTKTGETIGQLIKEGGDELIDASKLPEYQQRGLVFDEKLRLTKEKITKKYEALNTFNENLFTIILAFAFVFIFLLLAGIPIIFSRLRLNR